MTQLLGKITADFSTSLAVGMSIGATTGTLQSATDSDGVALPTGRYFFTIDRNNSSKEYISCTLTGTALTNIKTMTRQGVETSGTARVHRVGANVIISDFAHIKKINDLLDGTTNLDAGTPLAYDGTVTPTLPNQLMTRSAVLAVVTGGAVTYSQATVNGTAGETIASPNIVYFKESDQRWWLADADVTATFDQVELGIVLTGNTAGNGVVIIKLGYATNFSGLTAGSKYYLSNTAGGVTTSSSQTTQVYLGTAVNTTTLDFNPRIIYMPTAIEKSAITGLATFTGALIPTSRRSAPSGWLLCNGSAVSRATYADLFTAIVPTGTFTVTIATPAVFTKVAHTLVEGDIVHFTTTGALPTGLATNTDYYIISTGLTTDTFQVSTTRSGTAVNTTGSQSGTHTFFATNYGKGDGSTTFNLPDLRGKTVYGYDVSDVNFSSINVPKTYVGEKTHVLTVAELAAHTHTGPVSGAAFSGGSPGGAAGGSGNSGSTGSDAAHNNMPPYSVVNWLIKT
jgi:microcystin-dependent protein